MLNFANAKINLGLHLVEKRKDGYHNLETVLYPIRIFDTIEIVDAPEISCAIAGLEIPGDSNDNLCVQAFRRLQQDFEIPNQQIVLLKNIPVGAGLGGGSADAAFLIKLVNDKFNLDLSFAEMENYARELGADCAFFIRNHAVFAFDKGDQFEPISLDLSRFYLVLIKPPIHVSTALAYAGVSVSKPNKSIKEILNHPIEQWRDLLVNDFEKSVFKKFHAISELKEMLYQKGAIFAAMSGSGSSVFGIFTSKVDLSELERENMVFYDV